MDKLNLSVTKIGKTREHLQKGKLSTVGLLFKTAYLEIRNVYFKVLKAADQN